MNQGIPVRETTREIRSLARTALRTVWGKVFVCYFIYQCVVAYLPTLLCNIFPVLYKTYSIEYMGVPAAVQYSYLPLAFLVIFNGPFLLSFSKIYLKVARERTTDIQDITYGFRFVGKAVLTWILMILLVAVGIIPIAALTGALALLLMTGGPVLQGIGAGITSIGMIISMVVGTIIYFMVAMSFYVLADNTKLKPMGAIKASISIMKPNAFSLIILRLSYLGWLFLAATLSYSLASSLSMVFPESSLIVTIISNIPMIFASVYMNMGDAFFYEFATGHLRKTAPAYNNAAPPSGFGY